jgi:hypothetical protein
MFMFVQPDSSPATQSTNVAASSAAAAVCRLCGKPPEETPFSNSQKKRLGKGKEATCKVCSNTKKSGNVIPAKDSPTASEKKAKRTEKVMQ